MTQQFTHSTIKYRSETKSCSPHLSVLNPNLDLGLQEQLMVSSVKLNQDNVRKGIMIIMSCMDEETVLLK